ncbi:zwei Ig domain protein zig-8-like isoform X1 [Mya arenaria]|uniref:zwei Ig domain protein zig-8-like isoform X1 n=1 Tax=Mya arenaria TaxID=6604 RepID=UPI0022E3B8AE|nr:zwei Ig domain protein zig-8-like isoform X1 [Mya arenaria]
MLPLRLDHILRIYLCIVQLLFLSTFLISNLVTVCTAAIDYVDDYEGPTYFIPQPNNVTFKPGQTALLRCSVENLGKKYIVWRKAAEPHPISVGTVIYSPDTRYTVQFSPERREYNLQIRGLTNTDSGVYECQVSSREKLVRHVLLRVEGRPNNLPSKSQISRDSDDPAMNPSYVMPEIFLSGKEYVNSGETIYLVCNVTGNTDIPQDVDWFKNGHLLRSHVSKKIKIVKVTSMAKRKLDSVLEIRDSKIEDSGMYICRNSEILIASQKVTVLNEEKSNTGKRGTAAEAKSGQMCNKQWWTLFLAVFLSMVVTDVFLYLR